VNKFVPVITWPAPAADHLWHGLSASQLNAAAGVPGSFVYTPGAGTVLNAGARTLHATFTPTDTTTTPRNGDPDRDVEQGSSGDHLAGSGSHHYGTALSATQLNATASVPGAFVYSQAAGSVLKAGTHT